MGLFYSSRSASSSLKAQTNFGGEGFHPDGVDEYKALEGIEVSPSIRTIIKRQLGVSKNLETWLRCMQHSLLSSSLSLAV